jgi:hypothetical protein
MACRIVPHTPSYTHLHGARKFLHGRCPSIQAHTDIDSTDAYPVLHRPTPHPSVCRQAFQDSTPF